MPKQVREAVALQSANIAQKAILDNMATKLIRTLKVVKRWEAPGARSVRDDEDAAAAFAALDEIAEVVSMTRDQATEMRTHHLQYPDARIQAVLDEAVDKMSAILLDDVG